MNFEKYQYYFEESMKIRNNHDVLLAIENQTKLSGETKKLMDRRYELEDKLFTIYHSISTEDIDNHILGGEELPEHERLNQLIYLWINNDPKLNIIREKFALSGKQEEINVLENEYQNVLFEYFLSLLKLDTAINEAREKLFSKAYKDKMKEYADNGVLLYFLETPDAPILSDGITIEDTLESLSFGKYISLKTLFYHFVFQENPSPSMKRKIEDIISAIDCLEHGQLRSAARTVFALLESEHKNCSSAMDNYFTLDKRVRKGIQRAEKIQQLLDGLKTQTYFSNVWKIVNPLYKNILVSKAESFIDRNSIIHGDYYSDKLDITENDVIKLLLLYINMRMISDHIQLYCDMLQKSLNYLEIHLAQELKKTTK